MITVIRRIAVAGQLVARLCERALTRCAMTRW